MRLLDEITDVIEPARLQSLRLESGLAIEYSALQGYALSGDSAQLLRYRSTTDADALELASLQHLAPRLGADAVEDLAAVQRRITEWQSLNRVLFGGTLSPGQFRAAGLSQPALRDSIINEIDLLPSRLSAAAAKRRAELRSHEQQSLFVNAALVCVALASLAAVFVLGRRERRLAYENVRLIEEAREGRRELERVMRSRQRLIRGFSHDVKNPLGAAVGYADLLSLGLFGELSAQQQESIAHMRGSIRAALDLIDELHELSRTETGNVVLRRDTVDPGELARSIGDEYRGAAIASGLVLNVEVAHDTPTIESDGARVRQIVGNLLSNAIKYTGTGSVTLRVEAKRSMSTQSADGWVHFDVIDTGLGIPADKRESIFEEFSRLGANDKAGAGLGLAISERLSRALGGSIVVDSEVGHGSTFTLRIPLRAPEDPDAAPLALSQPRHVTLPAEALPAE